MRSQCERVGGWGSTTGGSSAQGRLPHVSAQRAYGDGTRARTHVGRHEGAPEDRLAAKLGRKGERIRVQLVRGTQEALHEAAPRQRLFLDCDRRRSSTDHGRRLCGGLAPSLEVRHHDFVHVLDRGLVLCAAFVVIVVVVVVFIAAVVVVVFVVVVVVVFVVVFVVFVVVLVFGLDAARNASQRCGALRGFGGSACASTTASPYAVRAGAACGRRVAVRAAALLCGGGALDDAARVGGRVAVLREVQLLLPR